MTGPVLSPDDTWSRPTILSTEREQNTWSQFDQLDGVIYTFFKSWLEIFCLCKCDGIFILQQTSMLDAQIVTNQMDLELNWFQSLTTVCICAAGKIHTGLVVKKPFKINLLALDKLRQACQVGLKGPE